MRYISLIRRGVRSLAESCGFSSDIVADVEVAVCEAVTNSVMHGSPNPNEDSVFIKCISSSERLVVEIEDRSPTDSIPCCPTECDPKNESGRGVLIMHKLMDECENIRTDHGIIVRMAKQNRS